MLSEQEEPVEFVRCGRQSTPLEKGDPGGVDMLDWIERDEEDSARR